MIETSLLESASANLPPNGASSCKAMKFRHHLQKTKQHIQKRKDQKKHTQTAIRDSVFVCVCVCVSVYVCMRVQLTHVALVSLDYV